MRGTNVLVVTVVYNQWEAQRVKLFQKIQPDAAPASPKVQVLEDDESSTMKAFSKNIEVSSIHLL